MVRTTGELGFLKDIMRSLVFFNNKGGVGKTTLACNMATHIADTMGISVLLVDLDPQCNATQLLLDEDQWDQVYGNRLKSSKRTVLKSLRHIRSGDSGVDVDFDILRSERFGYDVLPGHPSMALVEDRLSTAWGDFLAGDPGAARRSMWVATLVANAAYDLVIFDVGPSLGALNRTVLLGSDGFVTPMSADLFSLYALDNISSWMHSWLRDYQRAYRSTIEKEPESSELLDLGEDPPIIGGFLGYTVQQYVSKSMRGGSSRKVNAYERYRRQIPDRAQELKDFSTSDIQQFDLGVVPNMFSMVPLAQTVHSPIRDLTNSDGVRGAQASQHQRYVARLNEISSRLVENIQLMRAVNAAG